MTDLVWVAVPGGAVHDGRTVLRVLVVPRLSGRPDDAPLKEYGMQAWTGVVDRTTFAVEVAVVGAGDVVSDASPVDGVVPRLEHLRPDRWPEVFPPDLRVRPFGLPTPYAAPRVEPTSEHARELRRMYAEAAQPGPGRGLEALRGASLGTAAVVPRPPGEDEQPAPVRQEPDFHRVVTMLREHPTVLRALGLMVELEVPDAAQLGSAGVVRVLATLPGEGPAGPGTPELTMKTPWTRFTLADDRFLPAAGPGSDLAHGLVDLAATLPGREHERRWHVETFDVAGAVERARATRARVLDATVSAAPDAVEETALSARPVPTGLLPAVRSAGLSLVRRNRQTVLEARADLAASRHGADLDRTLLDADDLVLGYRVDVRLSDGTWQSLMFRQASYQTATGAELVPEQDEEGHLKPHAVTVVDDRKPDTGGRGEVDGRDARVTRADEVVARWDGWSLTTTRPALQRRTDRRQLDHLRWQQTPFGVPALRFGEQYTMRVRVADAAGGGLLIDEVDDDASASEEVFYGRHDPVRPPVMVPPPESLDTTPRPVDEESGGAKLHRPLGPGGSLEVVVIRSDPIRGKGVTDFAPFFPLNDRRVFLPPQASFALVEQHGELDELTDEAVGDLLRRAMEPEQVLRTGPEGAERVTHSWLPDPVAERMAVTIRSSDVDDVVLDGDTARAAWRQPGDEKWPDFSAKTLQLQPRGSTSQPRLEWRQSATAVVRLLPAEDVVVAVSSTIRATQTSLFSMRGWLQGYRVLDPEDPDGPGEPLDEDLVATILDAVRDGRHGLVTPAHDLRLVHAVQHPLSNPTGVVVATRQVGDTRASISGQDDGLLGVDVASTGQVELVARWTEVTDREDPADPAADLQRRDVAVTVQVSRLDREADRLPDLVHELGDTKHRAIDYTLTALSRFGDYFETADLESEPLTRTVHVPSSERPPEPVVLSVTPAFRWSGTELPDGWTEVRRTRHGGVFRLELDTPWLLSGTDEQLAILLRADPGTPARSCTSTRRDPVYATPAPGLDPAPGVFGGVDGEVVRLPLADGDGEVLAVPFTPRLSTTGGPGTGRHWYVDVEMTETSEASYWPFVSLAVARYQPFSVPGQELSKVVRCEPVQLTRGAP